MVVMPFYKLPPPPPPPFIPMNLLPVTSRMNLDSVYVLHVPEIIYILSLHVPQNETIGF